MIKPAGFIHPEEATALRQLESIPGFPALAKVMIILGFRNLQYDIDMTTTNFCCG